MKDKMDDKLIIIGGAEDKKGEKKILSYVASKLKKNETLIVATIASKLPKENIRQYSKVFHKLGVENVKELTINNRDECYHEDKINLVKSAKLIFFTGGDQLRITSMLGGTPLYAAIKEQLDDNAIYVGTSAGASVVSETMLVCGEEEMSPSKCRVDMSVGLGLIKGIIIDQHFAQRGRIGRLLCVVAQNPQTIGIGIDEDTAIIINKENELQVIGSGAVYIIDGRNMTYSNVSEQDCDELLSMYNVVLHVLTEGKKYNLTTKMPFEEENFRDENNKSKNF